MKRKVSDVLENPFLYSLFQKLVKTQRYERHLDSLIGSPENLRVLDFGCGPGDLYPRLSRSNYLGIDPSENNIRRATERFGNSERVPEFKIGDESLVRSLPEESFDLVIAIGVLHHMSNESVLEFLHSAAKILRPTGIFLTLDPVRHSEESYLGGFLVGQDRGRNVRSPEGYLQLIRQNFDPMECGIKRGMLRIPYDQFSMNCKKRT